MKKVNGNDFFKRRSKWKPMLVKRKNRKLYSQKKNEFLK